MKFFGLLLIIYGIIAFFINPPLSEIFMNRKFIFIILGIIFLSIGDIYKKINKGKRTNIDASKLNESIRKIIDVTNITDKNQLERIKSLEADYLNDRITIEELEEQIKQINQQNTF